ncbi:archease [Candidatus Woesearchaeota archaeon]|nr:archease [Candidatus Woesearchaeota archaeon]
MQKEYEYLKDLTSDVAFKAYGNTFEEMLRNSGKALIGIMCEIENVKDKKSITTSAEGEDEKEILFNFLQALIAEVELNEMFFCEFEIKREGDKVSAICFGDDAKPEISRTHVKALTNYLFNLERTKKGYVSTVTVDI